MERPAQQEDREVGRWRHLAAVGEGRAGRGEGDDPERGHQREDADRAREAARRGAARRGRPARARPGLAGGSRRHSRASAPKRRACSGAPAVALPATPRHMRTLHEVRVSCAGSRPQRPGGERPATAARAGGARQHALSREADDVHPEGAPPPHGDRAAAGGRGTRRVRVLGLRHPHGAPAGRRDDAGPGGPRPVRHRLPHRGRGLHLRRGPDPLRRHPLPPAQGRRRAAAADPRQQQARDHLDGDPDRDRPRPLRHLLEHSQRHRRGEAEPAGPHRGRRLPVAVAVRLRARGDRAGRTAAPPRTPASASPSSASARRTATGRTGRRRRCTCPSTRPSSSRCTRWT